MNKKIIISLAIIGVVAAIAVGGTVAYFTDTETSTGNTFTAGTLDLKVDNTCHYNGMVCESNPAAQDGYYWKNEEGEFTDEPCTCSWGEKNLEGSDLFFSFNDVKPGDVGEDTISLHVDNNPAYVCAEVKNLEDKDNSCTEPEIGDEPGCEADLADGDNGELGENIIFTIWRDTGAEGERGKCDNVYQTGEEELVKGTLAQAGIWPIYDSAHGEAMPGNTTECIGVKWEIPEDVNNIIQSDSLKADISFTAIQARHNDTYICGEQPAQ